jgi:hypothetical protein
VLRVWRTFVAPRDPRVTLSLAWSAAMPDSVDVNRAMRGEPRWSAVSQVAGGQEGVISHEQLQRVGFSDDQISRLVRRGYLIRLHRGVYAVGHRCLSTKAHLIAALLAAGPEAFLSHRTAAALYGFRDVSTRRIDVTVPDCRRRSRGSLRIHTAARNPDVKTRNGLRVSSVPQMLLELALIETQRELERLITASVRKRILDLDRMRAALAANGRRPGSAKLKAALAAYLPTADRKSDLERAFDKFLAEHPEIPTPQTNVYIDGWEIDCYWPQHKLAVELDGRPYHIAVKDMEKDKLKDAKLLLLGIRVMRITDMRFQYDRDGIYDDLRAALGLLDRPTLYQR